MRAKRQERKLFLDDSHPLTPRERELLALFRVMTEPDRRLLLFTAQKLISGGAGLGSRTPEPG